MKLTDRQFVEGTEPRVYIGRRETGAGRSRARGKYWAEWNADGRRHYRALRTANKDVALREAHAISRRYMEGLGAPKVYRITVDELAEQYLERKRAEGRAPRTLSKYEFGLGYFRDWCRERGRTAAAKFTEEDFWAFTARITREGRSEKAKYDRQVLVCQLLKFGWKRRLIPEYPLSDVRLVKPGWKEQPCFTPEQVARVLAIAKPRHRAIFATMAYLGLRIGEVRDLRWEDVHFEAGLSGMVVVRRGGSRVGAAETTKGRKERRIPLHPALRPLLEALPRDGERVFPGGLNRRTGRPGVISDTSLLYTLKGLCARAGFADARKYKLHSFRHTFASMCARNNVSYKYALMWMGHSDSRILDLYYKAFDDTAQEAMRSIVYPTVGAAAVPATGKAAGANPPAAKSA